MPRPNSRSRRPIALYHELAPLYDRVYAWKDYRADARALLSLATRLLGRPPRSLLDAGCGTGHHLAEFRPRVGDVAGVDQSASMLREARARLGGDVPLTVGDLRTFDLGRTFDVVVCLFSAIGYLSGRRARDRAIDTFARHVAPGGVVLVEGWVLRSAWKGGHVHLTSYDGPEVKIARLAASTRRGRRSTITMHYLIGTPGRGVRHVIERHVQDLLEPEELLASFRTAGLRAWVRRGGRYRGRGLYIGVRPRGASSANSHPRGRSRSRRRPGRRRTERGDAPGATGRSGSPRRASVKRPSPRG